MANNEVFQGTWGMSQVISDLPCLDSSVETGRALVTSLACNYTLFTSHFSGEAVGFLHRQLLFALILDKCPVCA